MQMTEKTRENGMEAQRDDEMELDLRDLLFYLLRRWRALILSALVLGLLLGGYSARKGLHTLRDAEAVKEADTETEAARKQYDLLREVLNRQIAQIQEEIAAQDNYKETSILMNIDPYNEYRVSHVYYVSTDYQIMPGMSYQNPDRALSILNAYVKAAQSGQILNHVLSELKSEITIRNLKELIQVEADPGNHLFTIITKGESEKLPTSIMDYIEKDLKESQDAITESIGAHSIALVQKSSGYTVDMDLADLIGNQENNVTNLQMSLSQKQEELLKLKVPENSTVSRQSVMKEIGKYGAVGFFGGGFLALLGLLAAYLFGGRLFSEHGLEWKYGLQTLAHCYREKKKRPFGCIDKWIDRMAGVDMQEGGLFYQLADARIQALAGKESKVGIVSDMDQGELEAFHRQFLSLQSGIEYILLGNIHHDADQFRLLSKVDAFVIMADSERSRMPFVEKMVKDAKLFRKPVLGMLILS